MNGVRKPWTPDLDAELASLWNANLTQADIGIAMGRSKSAIHERAKDLNLPGRLLSNIHVKMGFWTAEKDAALEARFAQGWSHAQIAEEIGAASRNACIGRAHRLGLRREEAHNLKNKRASTVKATTASAFAAAKRRAAGLRIARPRPRLVIQAGNQVFETAPQREARAVARENAWEALEGSNPVLFSDPSFNRSQHCSWPVGLGVETRCAQPVDRGAYCACHADLAYVPPKARNSAQELVRSMRRYA